MAELMWPVWDHETSLMRASQAFTSQLNLVLQQQHVDVDGEDRMAPCGTLQRFVRQWMVDSWCDGMVENRSDPGFAA